MKTKSYTMFQVHISKDCREKSGKLNLAKGNNSYKKWVKHVTNSYAKN